MPGAPEALFAAATLFPQLAASAASWPWDDAAYTALLLLASTAAPWLLSRRMPPPSYARWRTALLVACRVAQTAAWAGLPSAEFWALVEPAGRWSWSPLPVGLVRVARLLAASRVLPQLLRWGSAPSGHLILDP